MDEIPARKKPANLKEALANFEHQFDAFEARAGHPSKALKIFFSAWTFCLWRRSILKLRLPMRSSPR